MACEGQFRVNKSKIRIFFIYGYEDNLEFLLSMQIARDKGQIKSSISKIKFVLKQYNLLY